MSTALVFFRARPEALLPFRSAILELYRTTQTNLDRTHSFLHVSHSAARHRICIARFSLRPTRLLSNRHPPRVLGTRSTTYPTIRDSLLKALTKSIHNCHHVFRRHGRVLHLRQPPRLLRSSAALASEAEGLQCLVACAQGAVVATQEPQTCRRESVSFSQPQHFSFYASLPPANTNICSPHADGQSRLRLHAAPQQP